jgi:hypothetical protein
MVITDFAIKLTLGVDDDNNSRRQSSLGFVFMPIRHKQ